MLSYIKVSLQEINISQLSYIVMYTFRRQLLAAAFFIHILIYVETLRFL